MQIKIGFVNNPRELVVTVDGDQADIAKELEAFLQETSEAGTTTLSDTKGSTFILRREHVAYIEVGTSAPRAVGFI